MDNYFEKFEHRVPPEPVPHSIPRELLYQYLATCNLTLGIWYLGWRWMYALNYDALWFSLPLAFAESCAFIGSMLFTYNLWKVEDEPKKRHHIRSRSVVSTPKKTGQSVLMCSFPVTMKNLNWLS